MQKIKVLEVIPNLQYGGAEKFVTDLMKYFDRDKFYVTLLLFYDDFESKYYKELKQLGCNIITLHKKLGLDLALFVKIYHLLNKMNPDIIHTHLRVDSYFLLYYIFHKKQRCYHTIHTTLTNEENPKYKKVMNWLYQHRQVVPVAIGDSVANSIKEQYNYNKHIPIIYNGIDTARFSMIEKNYNNEKISFIATGNLTEVKNQELMIKAFAQAYKTNQNITLTILGEGDLRNKLETLVTELNLQQVISMPGSVSNVQEYLQKADCFLMSSNIEGLPLSVLEAMSCGLPIVSTKAGGVVDIVNSNENGILIEVGDKDELAKAILSMTDKIKIEQYGKKSYEMSKQYDIRNCVKQYEELFINDKF